MHKLKDLFAQIDNLICAEQQGEYAQERIVPFYYNQEKKIKLFQGDALFILKKAPDSCIDMIFADPPYFGNQSGLVIKRNDGHADTFDTQKAKWAYSKSIGNALKFL
jgi:site-specific DNA-methyltransferase (adenine-specific)